MLVTSERERDRKTGMPPTVVFVTGLAAGTRDVELVLDFLNTIDLEAGTDVLDDEESWRRWAASRRLDAGGTSAQMSARQARVTRTALRRAVGDPDIVPMARGPAGPGDMDFVDAGFVDAVVRVRLDQGTPTLTAVDPVGAVLAAAARLAVLGDWDRVKICPADDCRWAFFDRSRNRSRTWCSMRVCGNREKARAWRERSRATVPG
jgi:predicted RNA-binding Zn ribbon-like protein